MMGQIERVRPKTTSDGVEYVLPGMTLQLLSDHSFREEVLGRPIRHWTMEQTILNGVDCVTLLDHEQGFKMAEDHHLLVAGEFWRVTYSKSFPYYKLDKREPKAFREAIQLEAQTWKAALACLEALNARENKKKWGFAYPSVNLGLALAGLIAEAKLISWQIVTTDTDKPRSTRDRIQSENAQLGRGKNPYADGLTAEFVQCCLAGIKDYPKLAEAWEVLLKARSKHLAAWIATNPPARDIRTGAPCNRVSAIAAKKAQQKKYTPKGKGNKK